MMNCRKLGRRNHHGHLIELDLVRFGKRRPAFTNRARILSSSLRLVNQPEVSAAQSRKQADQSNRIEFRRGLTAGPEKGRKYFSPGRSRHDEAQQPSGPATTRASRGSAVEPRALATIRQLAFEVASDM